MSEEIIKNQIEEKIKKQIKIAFSKLTDLTKSEKSHLNTIYKEINRNEFDERLITDLQTQIEKYKKIEKSAGDEKELFEAFLALAYHNRMKLYAGGKRKSRKTNRKSLRKRKNTLTKRRYRK